jgi:glycine/D-amino acid oxidase-like deaminating enzyme
MGYTISEYWKNGTDLPDASSCFFECRRPPATLHGVVFAILAARMQLRARPENGRARLPLRAISLRDRRGWRPGIFYNTGHGHLGWTLSAATAQMVADSVSKTVAIEGQNWAA